MPEPVFLDQIDPARLPPVYDEERAARVRDDLRAALAAGGPPLPEHDAAASLLAALFGNSPFLSRLALRDPEGFVHLLTAPLEPMWTALLGGVRSGAQQAEDEAALMRHLRRVRARAALAVAAADIACLWETSRVTLELSRFADAAICSAVDWLLRDAARQDRFVPLDAAAPSRDSGLIVLAMGKYGAHELNYSSDVDLVLFFERGVMARRGVDDPQRFAIGVARALVRILQDLTVDGYVFRIDLRLRPDAGATPAALSTEAAENYYETLGQNWERAAFIKARACAGDPEAGRRFLDRLRPFIWRKYLDFAAIADIHSIKRQIRAKAGRGIRIEGHNVKLGAGGIREIEFFAQTQQLIAGGRDPSLRARVTVDALAALAARRFITKGAARDLTRAYWYLRHVEHRLQMVEDQQTHKLPAARHGVDHIARFCGHAHTEEFRRALRRCLETVERHYGALFESEPPLSEEAGSLVFTGVEDDPDTIETLRKLGFKRPADVASAIRGWHHGRLRATRSVRARQMLTGLMPALLRALAATADPDQTFMRFDQLLAGLPSGVQFFALLQANADLLDRLAQALGTAPRLAGYLARNPQAVEALIAPHRDMPVPSADDLARDLEARLAAAAHYEAVLDASRQFARDHGFRISLAVLEGVAGPDAAGEAFADLAQTVIAGLLEPAARDLARRHGRLAGGQIAVVALGKLGGREMTATSDLDLLFIYDHPEAEGPSDGELALAPNHYFARLAQRLINALTVPTAEGKLYEVDMRLRPSGNKEPIATRLEGFVAYHARDAWIWEQMALTRARVVAGNAELSAKVEQAVRDVLRARREPDGVRAAVRDMRARLLREHAADVFWDIKQVRGGLVDVEFVTQGLQLCHAADDPSVLDISTQGALDRLKAADLLPRGAHRDLSEALRLYRNLQQVLAVAVSGPFRPDEAPEGLRRRLARSADVNDFPALERKLEACRDKAARWFVKLIGEA